MKYATPAVFLFIPVYLAMLYLGRQLRNRLGLRMGAPYHFIAVANGLLAAANFMDIEWERRRFLLATVVMLDSLLILTLFNRL